LCIINYDDKNNLLVFGEANMRKSILVLCSLLVLLTMVGQVGASILASDNFDRANGTGAASLPGWNVSAETYIGINSTKMNISVISRMAVYNQNFSNVNISFQTWELDNNITTTNQYHDIYFNKQYNNTSIISEGYRLTLQSGVNLGRLSLAYLSGTTATAVGGNINSGTWNESDVWMIDTSTVGTGLKIYKNSLLVGTVSAGNTSYSSGFVGFSLGNSNTEINYDNFSVSDNTSASPDVPCTNSLGRCLYVSTTGNNASTGTNISTAWQNVSYAVNQSVAGDIIYLLDGVWGDEQIIPITSGNVTHPITLTAYNGTPTLIGINSSAENDTAFYGIGQTDWVISGINFTQYRAGIQAGNNFTIQNNTFYWINRTAILSGNQNTIIRNNTIDYSRWNSIQNGGTTTAQTNTIIDSNRITNMREHGAIDMMSNYTNITISNNTIDGGTGGQLGIYSHQTTGNGYLNSGYLRIINNSITNVSGGISFDTVGQANNSWIEGNILFGSQNNMIKTNSINNNITILNNTMYGDATTGYMIQVYLINSLISGNNITRCCGNTNIRLISTSNTILQDNYDSTIGTYAVYLDGSFTNVFSDNKLFVISGFTPLYYLTNSSVFVDNAGTNNIVYYDDITFRPATNPMLVSNTTSRLTADYQNFNNSYINFSFGTGIGLMNVTLNNLTGANYTLANTTNTNISYQIPVSGTAYFNESLPNGAYWIIEAASQGASASTFIPPTPTSLTNISGNFWVNYTWQPGAGNITDFYNVSITNNSNQSWINGTTLNYLNSTLAAGQWSNLSVYAGNNSGTGTLNATPASQNTKLGYSCSSTITYNNTEITVYGGSVWSNPACIVEQVADSSITNISNNIWSINRTLHFNDTATTFILNSSSGLNEINLNSTNGINVTQLKLYNIIQSDDSVAIKSWNQSTNSEDTNTTSRASILFTWSSSGNISNLTVLGLGYNSGGTNNGIYTMASDNVNFNNVTVLRNYDGFYLYNTKINISNSNISNSLNSGIVLAADNEKVITLFNDTFINNQKAIHVSSIGSGNTTISNIYANNNQLDAILVETYAGNKNLSNLTIDGGTIDNSGAGYNNIKVDCSQTYRCNNITIKNLLLNNSGNAGILIDESEDSLIYNITIQNQTDDAITIFNSTRLNLSNNNITVGSVWGTGIWFDGDRAYDNYVYNNSIDAPYASWGMDNSTPFITYGTVGHVGTSNYAYNNYFIDTIVPENQVIHAIVFYIGSNYTMQWNNNNLYSVNAFAHAGERTRYTINPSNISITLIQTGLDAPYEDCCGWYRQWNITKLNGSIVPLISSNVTINSWLTEGNKSKSFTINSSNTTQQVNLTIGDLNASTNYSIKKDGVFWQMNQSNSTGWLIVPYTGGLNSTITIELNSTSVAINTTITCPVGWCYLAMNYSNKTLQELDDIQTQDYVQGKYNSTSQKYENHRISDSWRSYTANQNVTVSLKEGYYYYFRRPVSIDMNFTSNPAITLNTGWNLVGNLGSDRTLADLKSSIGVTATQATHFDTSRQSWNASDGHTVATGEAFMVYITSGSSWSG